MPAARPPRGGPLPVSLLASSPASQKRRKGAKRASFASQRSQEGGIYHPDIPPGTPRGYPHPTIFLLIYAPQSGVMSLVVHMEDYWARYVHRLVDGCALLCGTSTGRGFLP